MSGHRVVYLNGIVDFNASPISAQVRSHPSGADPYRQRTIGGVVHGQVTSALLEDHLGVDLTHTHQRNAILFDLEGRQRSLQAGELALLIAQCKAVASILLQPALCHQLDGLVLGVLIRLFPLDGNNDIIVLHIAFPSQARRCAQLSIASNYTRFLPVCKGLSARQYCTISIWVTASDTSRLRKRDASREKSCTLSLTK